MYYEDDRRRRRSRGGCLLRLIWWLVCAVVIWALLASAMTMVVNGGRMDILVLGIDYDSGGTSRSDTMMIISVGATGRVHVTSIMRDTWVDIPGHGQNKINAAYHYGGAELAMETVNEAFDMNIKYYAVISVRALPLLLDTIGGIDLDVTKAEAKNINSNLASVRALIAKTGVDTSELTEYGDNTHLTGAQALSYARIRAIGSDYERTARQRRVIAAALEKIRNVRNPYTFYKLISMGIKCIDTNVFWPQTIMLGAFAAVRNDLHSARIPADGKYTDGTFNGVWCIKPDLEANREYLRKFLND